MLKSIIEIEELIHIKIFISGDKTKILTAGKDSQDPIQSNIQTITKTIYETTTSKLKQKKDSSGSIEEDTKSPVEPKVSVD